jgi:hypothetical protein
VVVYIVRCSEYLLIGTPVTLHFTVFGVSINKYAYDPLTTI